MNVVVFGAVPGSDADGFYAALLDSADVVVGADAGAVHCLRLGRTPDVAVGDFDSAGEAGVADLEAAGVRIESHPVDKDASDLDLAVAVARGLGATTLTLTAAFAERADHTLASFGTLLRAADLAAVAVEPGWTAHPLIAGVRDAIDLDLAAGVVFSVMSPTGAGGVHVTGARHTLDAARLEPLSSLGVSNVALGGVMTVAVAAGSVIVLVSAS